MNCFFLFFLADRRKIYSLLQHIFRLLIFIFLDSKEHTAQKMKFSIKDFFTKSDQIRRKLQIRSHLLKKSLMENFTFFAVVSLIFAYLKNQELYELTLKTKKKTNRQNILLTGTDHCNSKVFKNIQFEKDIHMLLLMFQKFWEKSKAQAAYFGSIALFL